MKLSKIKPNPNNPRTIKDWQYQKLRNNILSFKKMLCIRPIVTDDNNQIIGGNMRFRVLQDLAKSGELETLTGLPKNEVPDKWIRKASEMAEEDLTNDEERQFCLLDNNPSGEWDFDALANEWDEIEIKDWAGIEMPELEANQLKANEDNYEPPEEIETDIKLGDLFQIGEHRLLCGDSTDIDQVAKLMNGQKARMTITSPPYANQREYSQWETYEKYLEFIQTIINNLLLIADKNYVCLWNIGSSESTNDFIPADNYRQFLNSGFKWIEWIVWNKESATWTIPRSQHIENGLYIPALRWESICVYLLGNRPHFNQRDVSQVREWQENVWNINKVIGSQQKKIGHTALFPVEMPFRAIMSYSKDDEVVYEPFCGGGTTMVAAHQLNRKCYGMEIDPKYCQVIIDRMKALDSSLEIKKLD